MAREKKAKVSIVPQNFIKMGEIRFKKGIPASVKIFYSELAAMCEDHGTIEVNAEYFAELYQVTTVTVSYWINNLLKRQLINMSLIVEDKVRVMKISMN